jgi:hypothetical protein
MLGRLGGSARIHKLATKGEAPGECGESGEDGGEDDEFDDGARGPVRVGRLTEREREGPRDLETVFILQHHSSHILTAHLVKTILSPVHS